MEIEEFGDQEKIISMHNIDCMTIEDLQALKYVVQQITNQCYKDDQPLYSKINLHPSIILLLHGLFWYGFLLPFCQLISLFWF